MANVAPTAPELPPVRVTVLRHVGDATARGLIALRRGARPRGEGGPVARRQDAGAIAWKDDGAGKVSISGAVPARRLERRGKLVVVATGLFQSDTTDSPNQTIRIGRGSGKDANPSNGCMQ